MALDEQSIDPSENGFNVKFNKFFSGHIDKFDENLDVEGEQNLEYTDVHNEYVAYYEEEMANLFR